jgi:hypothetical protein
MGACVPDRLTGVAIIALVLIVACGGTASTPPGPSPSPSPSPLSARAIAVQPPDFAGVSMRVCPAPATATFADYTAAYRVGIKRQPLILAANLAAAKADGWSQTLTGSPASCKGALGFATNGDDPTVMSYTFVFTTEADAIAAFPTVGAGTFLPRVRGNQTGFGANSAGSEYAGSYWISWQHKTVIALVECDNVPSCKQGAQALDSRIV